MKTRSNSGLITTRDKIYSKNTPTTHKIMLNCKANSLFFTFFLIFYFCWFRAGVWYANFFKSSQKDQYLNQYRSNEFLTQIIVVFKPQYLYCKKNFSNRLSIRLEIAWLTTTTTTTPLTSSYVNNAPRALLMKQIKSKPFMFHRKYFNKWHAVF